MMRGNAILALQFALNALGYTDASGQPLSEDGKCGRKTLFAVDDFAKTQLGLKDRPVFLLPSEDGEQKLVITLLPT